MAKIIIYKMIIVAETVKSRPVRIHSFPSLHRVPTVERSPPPVFGWCPFNNSRRWAAVAVAVVLLFSPFRSPQPKIWCAAGPGGQLPFVSRPPVQFTSISRPLVARFLPRILQNKVENYGNRWQLFCPLLLPLNSASEIFFLHTG